MADTQVGQFTLKADGNYIFRIMFNYSNNDGSKHISNQTGDQAFQQVYTIDPGTLGVPDGCLVMFRLYVQNGMDEIATETFIYKKGSSGTAAYMCDGKALMTGKLHFLGVTS